MTADSSFDSVAKDFGFYGVSAESFANAFDDAIKTKNRVYFTSKGFESGKQLKFYEKFRGIKIPVQTLKKLAVVVNKKIEADSLQESRLERLIKPSLQKELQKKARTIYKVFNDFAKKDINGTPQFLKMVRQEDLGKVRKAIDSILTSPHEITRVNELLYDTNAHNPLHELALNPHLEGTSLVRYMTELKRLNPRAEELWLQPDTNGVTPLSLAASELNFAVFDYIINYSDIPREKIVESNDTFIEELLNRYLSGSISKSLAESGKVKNPFEVKQRMRRMLVAAVEEFPQLAQTAEIHKLLQNNKFADDIKYVIEHADKIHATGNQRRQLTKALKEECAAFEETLKGPISAEEKIQKLNDRIEEIQTILAKRAENLSKINERNSEGLTLLQQKVQEGDIEFIRDLCNPLRAYDQFVDFSDEELMKTTGGIHLLQLAQESNEHSEEMMKALLSKAPELAQQSGLSKEYNAAELAVEKDQVLKSQGLQNAVFKKHLLYLHEIKPILEAEKQGIKAHLQSSPKLTRKAETHMTPKEKRMSEIVGFVLSKGTLIKALFSAAGTSIKARFTSIVNANKAQKYKAEALRKLSSIPQTIAQKKLFEGRVVQVAANIGSREVINTEKDQQAARALYNDFVARNDAIHISKTPNQKFQTMPWGKLESEPGGWKGIITSGVCWGTVMDLISRYHESIDENGFSELENLAKIYSKGAPESACANQAIYHALNSYSEHPVQIVFNHLELIGRLNGIESGLKKGLFNADFTTLQKLFAHIMANEVSKTTEPNFRRENKVQDASNLRDFSDSISSNHPLVQMCLEQLKSFPRLMYDNASNSVEMFCSRLRNGWTSYIETHSTSPADWALGLNTITWLEGLLMQQVGCRDFYLIAMGVKQRQEQEATGVTHDSRFDKIPDVRLRAFLAEADANGQSHLVESKIIEMRNLQQQAIHGLPERFVARTDADYLRNFINLEDGAYVISYSTHGFQASSAHSIAYFKQGDQGYIFDPNVGLIKCIDGKHAQDLLKLLSVYKIPKGNTSHDIEIRKVTNLSNSI